MSLSDLKNKANTYQNTKKVTKAMQNIAAVKLLRLKQLLVSAKSHFLKLKEINRINLENIIITEEVENYNLIYFGPKKGLCAGLARRVLLETEFKEICTKSKSINCVEFPIAKLISESGFKIDNCFENLSDGGYSTLAILENFKKELINTPSVVATNTKSNLTFKVIYPKTENHKLEFKTISINITNNIQHWLTLVAVLEMAYYETRLTEEEQRVDSMFQASENCTALYNSVKLKYFKARQQKITQEILEISN